MPAICQYVIFNQGFLVKVKMTSYQKTTDDFLTKTRSSFRNHCQRKQTECLLHHHLQAAVLVNTLQTRIPRHRALLHRSNFKNQPLCWLMGSDCDPRLSLTSLSSWAQLCTAQHSKNPGFWSVVHSQKPWQNQWNALERSLKWLDDYLLNKYNRWFQCFKGEDLMHFSVFCCGKLLSENT